MPKRALELFAGQAELSGALRTLGWEVITFEILDDPTQDVLCDETLQSLLRAVEAGDFGYIRSGSPCTTASLARHPALRSPQEPEGKRRGLSHQQRCKCSEGNEFFRRSLQVFQAAAGPDVARDWARLLVDPAAWGATPAWRLIPRQAHYPWRVPRRLARVAPRPTPGRPSGAAAKEKTARFAAPWEEALADVVPSLPWRTVLAWRDNRGSHINVLELRGRNRLLRRLARRVRFHHHRVVGLCDSRVVLGCTAKGRSASRQLNRELRLAVPDVLGADIELAEFYVFTEMMPADAPSRGAPVAPPTPANRWVAQFMGGQTALVTLQTERAWRNRTWAPAAHWAPRNSGYAHRGERVGEASNPGPALPAATAGPLTSGGRIPRQLGSRLELVTKRNYTLHGMRFQRWLAEQGHPGLPTLATEPLLIKLNTVLVEYIQFLYDTGLPRDHGEFAILFVQKAFFWVRGMLKLAWAAINEWKDAYPPEVRVPILAPVLKAMISVAVTWGWPLMGVLYWVGFHCLLRPQEMISLRLSDIRLCDDFDPQCATPSAVVAVLNSKTRKRGPRKQHVLIEDSALVSALRHLKGQFDPATRLFPFTLATLNRRHACIQQALGLRFLNTPASLRPGGATFEYLRTGSVQRLRYRGRWAQERTLDYYIQDCTAAMVAAQESPEVRSRILQLAALAPRALEELFFCTGNLQTLG